MVWNVYNFSNVGSYSPMKRLVMKRTISAGEKMNSVNYLWHLILSLNVLPIIISGLLGSWYENLYHSWMIPPFNVNIYLKKPTNDYQQNRFCFKCLDILFFKLLGDQPKFTVFIQTKGLVYKIITSVMSFV